MPEARCRSFFRMSGMKRRKYGHFAGSACGPHWTACATRRSGSHGGGLQASKTFPMPAPAYRSHRQRSFPKDRLTRLDSPLPGYASVAVFQRCGRPARAMKAKRSGNAPYAAKHRDLPMSACSASRETTRPELPENGSILKSQWNPARPAGRWDGTTTGLTMT